MTTSNPTGTKIRKDRVKLGDVVAVRWVFRRTESEGGRAKSLDRLCTFGKVTKLSDGTVFVARDCAPVKDGLIRNIAGIPRDVIEEVILLQRTDDGSEETAE